MSTTNRRRAIALAALAAVFMAPAAIAKTRYLNERLSVPAPHKSRNVRVTVKAPKHLRRFHLQMAVRRTDGRIGRRVEIGQTATLEDRPGHAAVKLSFTAKYSPERGRLRYTIKVRNVGIPRATYRRAVVDVVLIVSY